MTTRLRTRDYSSISALDAAWLAGLMEGEGSFGWASGRNFPRISIQMTDEDVISRVADLWGVAYHKSSSKRNSQWKPVFFCALRGSNAVEIMRLLLPHMGERRSLKILEVLDSWHPETKIVGSLTDEQVLEVRRRKPEGVEAIAREFGLSKWTIYKVWQGVLYGHVLQ